MFQFLYCYCAIKLFDYIESSQGTIQALFQYDYTKEKIQKIKILMYDPVYHDTRAISCSFSLNKSYQKVQWHNNNTKIKTYKYWKQNTIQQNEFQLIDSTIYVSNSEFSNPQLLQLSINLKSEKSNFSATLQYKLTETSSIFIYCFYLTFILSIQIICGTYLINQKQGQIFTKISVITIALCGIEDSVRTFQHLHYVMVYRSLLLIIPFIAYSILLVVIDFWIPFLIWKSLRKNKQSLIRLIFVYFINYSGIFLYLPLIYFFKNYQWFIIAQYMFLLPQIIHNVRVGSNPGFIPSYIFGYIGSRYLILIYERYYTENIFMLSPQRDLVVKISILYLFQVCFLYLQYKFGGRFFLPCCRNNNHTSSQIRVNSQIDSSRPAQLE